MFSLFRENVRIALDSIKSQLLRTILTIVIIGIGIWALVGILSAVTALENTISGNFASMGANTFNIQQYEFSVQTNNSGEREKINPIISYNNVREFIDKYEFPYTQTSLSFQGTSTAEVKYGSEKTDPEVQVYGVNENYLENTGTEIDKGRNFTVFDIQNNNKVCLIGADFVKNLFEDEDPINKTISIRGVKFKVIGLLESKGSTFGNNQDLKVLIPVQVARGIFTQPNINYNLSVKVDDKQMMEAAQDEAIITFRNIRGLSPVEENNFGIERSDDLINRIAMITGYLEVAAWIISIITILGSSIALMNIMLVSVTERTREIGVRKAMGAKRSTISTQFFMETIVIGQFGSILGIILGILTGFAFAKIFKFDFTLPWTAIIWATIITFIVAVIAGSYPASKAARLDPIESLRYE
ncbi:ABC transporter permease [Aequorivita vladivostokensis]|uniref:ABC transporter permease n=1 Tax=Aequorivita vladivostokensis TaxID=171194 RepID=A0ABR5DL16_9FLAO|nr:ABC transporter permease [Aequorivita vladivostokensis]MAB58297.1 ABC transporter permease [Aequorivita sp.]KJJ39460.1 ABC transporter permease [Aequorivita vladivostokensis]MAO47949.1 ABC transporter permease [Aequorivita sp.]MBF31430.1 ABC transporter permease [Aequorivita sp.]MDX1783161.1 ABC transporter permease [Aequorivita vladivostokensis]|tara:strand:+ start:93141 stop:94382 length:1242 start_codon:yes stop_codon:yes gene_type:complete